MLRLITYCAKYHWALHGILEDMPGHNPNHDMCHNHDTTNATTKKEDRGEVKILSLSLYTPGDDNLLQH